ncbi:MAG TPA: hypothetical protein V6D47_22115 [Oscillatoriaceae cyanobacterium]
MMLRRSITALAAAMLLAACSHAPLPTTGAPAAALTAQDDPYTTVPIPPVLYDEVHAAEKLMAKPVAYKSSQELDVYLNSIARALPMSSYDHAGFLQSLGLKDQLAPGKTDQPTLQALEHLPNFRPGTLVNGHEILPQVLAYKIAIAHPNFFLDTIKRLNPIIEVHSLNAALWKKPFKAVQKAHPTGETVAQRYAAALTKLPKTAFDADFHSGLPGTLPAGQPGYGTYTIAQNLGFTPDQAKRFATNDNNVDFDKTPYGKTSFSPLGQMDRHFDLDRDHQDTRLVWASRHLNAAEDYARQGAYDQAEVELGVGLHSLQDCFAHGQLTPCMHGVIGEFPDDVTYDPIAFYEATDATVAYLWAYLRAIAPANAWDVTGGTLL